MNKMIAQITRLSTRINRQHLQAVFALLALVLLVLGAGAPDDGSTPPGIR